MSKQVSSLRAFGEFLLDAEKRVLWHEGTPVDLALKEIEILCLLTERRGDVVTKTELFDRVWQDSFVEESSLSRHVYVLRQVLKRCGARDGLIKTIPRRGYRFAGEIRDIEADEIAVERHSRTRTVIEVSPVQPATAPQRTVLLPLVTAAVLVVGLSIASFVIYQGFIVAESARSVRTLAVLPFSTVDPEDSDGRRGFGMADLLITKLSRVKELSVRPTSSVASFSGTDSAEFGRRLQVDAVLEGTIHRVGDRIRVTTRLVRTSDNSSIWSESFDGRITEELSMQKDIALKIAGVLALDLTGNELEKLGLPISASPDAVGLYASGRIDWNKRTIEGLTNAETSFRRSIEADPNFALAWVGLADTLGMRGEFEEAMVAAERALELDPNLGEAHAALGFLQMFGSREWHLAEDSLRRATELNPGYTPARQWLATLFMIKGNTAAAKEHLSHALEIDPLSPNLIADLGQVHYFAREYDQAEELCLKALQIDPDFLFAQKYLADIRLQNGDHRGYVESENAAHRLQQTFIKSERAQESFTARQNAFREQFEKGGIQGYLRYRVTEQVDDPAAEYGRAIFLTRLGDDEAALQALEKAVTARVFISVFAGAEPAFAPLHDSPKFKEILKRMNL